MPFKSVPFSSMQEYLVVGQSCGAGPPFIDDTVKQVKRLERGLKARPEVVESLFGRKLSDLTVVPMILNSMNYSRPPVDGVYVSDYSALSKFFDESTISEFHWENGKKKVRKVICRLWSGEQPTAQELLAYLSIPPQLKLIADYLTYICHPRPTSENSIFFSGVLEVDESALQKAKQEAPAVASLEECGKQRWPPVPVSETEESF